MSSKIFKFLLFLILIFIILLFITKNQSISFYSPFKTGYIKNTPQKIADYCNKTMYPVQLEYVNYTKENDTNKNCDCDVSKFNSSP